MGRSRYALCGSPPQQRMLNLYTPTLSRGPPIFPSGHRPPMCGRHSILRSVDCRKCQSCSFCGIVVSIPALAMLGLCQTSMRRVELEIISRGEYTTSALLTIEDILTGHTRLGSLTLAGLCLTYALSKMSRQNNTRHFPKQHTSPTGSLLDC